MFLSRSRGHLLVAGICALLVLNAGAAQTLTNCAQILSLSPEAAKQEHPARVRAVVTCYIPASQLCFVQDDTAGIYVHPAVWLKEFAPGTVVDVEGVSGTGRFSPILQKARMTPSGQRSEIQPKRIAIEELNGGRFDSQWVELEGVVQRVESVANAQTVQLVSGGSTVTVLYFPGDAAITNWVDARVRLRGVAGTYYSENRLTGFGLFVPSATDVEILLAQSNPFERPLRPAGKLAWYSPEGAMDHRIRVRGLVTVAWSGEPFFVEDPTGAVQVFGVPGQPEPRPGDMVELSGFIRNGTTPVPSLVGTLWRKTGNGTHPAKEVRAVELRKQPPNGQLVSIEGTVLNQSSTGDLAFALLEQNGRVIPVFNDGPWGEDLRNSVIKVTGAWSSCPSQLTTGGIETGPGIWLRSINDLVILSRPTKAVATVAALDTRFIVAVAGACTLLGGILAWRGYTAKRRVSEELRNVKGELVQMQESRDRLGRDLHDHIIQSIYATGLSIEESRQLLNEPGKAEPRLNSALGAINGVIRELRNVIQGLETSTIQPTEFRTALKSVALMLGGEKSSQVRLDLDQEAVDQLTSPQATELIHIAREAISNSTRHGKALTNSFALHVVSDKLRFIIEDDGCGFAPGTAETSGYGLRNMAKRAEGLGAEFTVHSQEGAGTRIVLDIPRQKPHSSNSESSARTDRRRP